MNQITHGSTILEITHEDGVRAVDGYISGNKCYSFTTQGLDLEEIKKDFICMVDQFYYGSCDRVCNAVYNSVNNN